MTVIHIPEAEFRAYVRRRRQELAEAIAQGKPVRNESQDRVRCYLEAVNTNEQ